MWWQIPLSQRFNRFEVHVHIVFGTFLLTVSWLPFFPEEAGSLTPLVEDVVDSIHGDGEVVFLWISVGVDEMQPSTFRRMEDAIARLKEA